MTQTDDARGFGCIHMTADMARNCPTCNPLPRADLAPTPPDPRVAALMQAVQEAGLQIEYLDSGSPRGTSQVVLARIDAALAAFDTGGKDE